MVLKKIKNLLDKIGIKKDSYPLKNDTISTYQEAIKMKEFLDTIDKGIKEYSHDFYITVITKNEKLMPNVFRNYFFHRKSCPTPDYDQSVYRYNRLLERVEYLWTVPSKKSCKFLKKNALYIPPEQRQLLQFVFDFYDGTLLKLSKRRNGEQPDSPLLVH